MNRALALTLKLALGLLLGLAVLVAGFVAGRWSAPSGPGSGESAETRQRREALRVVAEAYQPSCDELAVDGLRRVSSGEDGTYLFLANSDDRFQVLGVQVTPGEPPITYWWGAGRAHALEGCR